MYTQTRKKISRNSLLRTELMEYYNTDDIEPEGDPLKWWKTNAIKFPNVAKYAKCILGIPATSVPSERIFSTAGNIITEQRSALLPENANKLIFIKHNKQYYNIAG